MEYEKFFTAAYPSQEQNQSAGHHVWYLEFRDSVVAVCDCRWSATELRAGIPANARCSRMNRKICEHCTKMMEKNAKAAAKAAGK